MTIGLVVTNAHVFSNGMNQNAIYLYILMKTSGFKCELLSFEPSLSVIENIPVRHLTPANVCDFTTIITVSTGLDKEIYDKCLKTGIQVIGYVCSNQLCMAIEETATAHSRSTIIGHTTPIQKAWIFDGFPFMKTYIELMRRVKAEYVSHVWNASIIENYCATRMKKDPNLMVYNPSKHISPKINIVICESNLNFVKTGIVPLLAAEKLYVLNPDLIQEIFLFSYPTESKALDAMVSNLRCGHLVRKFTRQVIPHIFCHFNEKIPVPVFVAHQIYTPLNYSYYETMYYGFPFVHNSPTLKDYGHYYTDMDIDMCAIQIMKAFKTHASEFETRLTNNRKWLEFIDPVHPSCVERWRPILASLVKELK
jgi:hypothetical protein